MQIRGGPGPPGLQRQDMAQRIHQRMDRDQDGSVSKAELIDMATSRGASGPAVQVHIDAIYDKLDADASGGLSVGEPAPVMYEVVEVVTAELPREKPRYLMGVGTPDDLLEAIERGVDMFDCVMPTRNGRNGFAFTETGPIKIRNAKHKTDTRPLDETCECLACTRHSRGYLRHLFIAGEMLGPTLMSLHNLTYNQKVMQGARDAIEADRLEAYVAQKKQQWGIS